jgi:putative spermidine/putrescine transport system ATP-binding protein
VASFIGTTNLIPARKDGAIGAAVPGGHIPGLMLQGPATVSVRPEDIALTDPANAAMQGDVTFVRDLGSTIEVFIDCEGTEIVAVESPRDRRAIETGSRVGVTIMPEHCVVLGP